MPGIFTITLNPAIDKSTSVEGLGPDKKMRCSAPHFEPGGGGVNVSRALRRLGMSSTAIYFAGGHSGRFYRQLLDQQQIQSHELPIKDHTRENLIVLDTLDNKQYRFGMPGPTVQPGEWQALIAAFSEYEGPDFLVCSGSLPPGLPVDCYAELGNLAREKGARFVLDTSGEALKAGLVPGTFLIKPNIGELSRLAGKKWIEDSELQQTATRVLTDYEIQAMVVSRGKAGAVLVTSSDYFEIKPPSVEKKSTVGAGDSMVAGIIYVLQSGGSMRDAACYGVACGTAATLNPGTELCARKDADRILQQLSF
ncbi:MAG: 1-phosphofructokinase family hexose kinase [Chitinophagaceae bacterium]